MTIVIALLLGPRLLHETALARAAATLLVELVARLWWSAQPNAPHLRRTTPSAPSSLCLQSRPAPRASALATALS